ncbi:MAG: hypothetical protein HYT12_00965 [Candidatus Liptonbacteria bacterium]|nr:hypothetical protein [Candidatus Liptonbacteria bacterium]
MELNLIQFIRPVALLLFVVVYVFVLVVGVATFYHIRWYGLKGDRTYKKIEWWFIAINAVLFLVNSGILISILQGV